MVTPTAFRPWAAWTWIPWVSGLWIPSRLSGRSSRSSCSLRPVGRRLAGLLRRRCLAFPFLPGVQLFSGEAQKFLSVELGAGDGGDGAPAAVVVALSCGGKPYPDPGDAAPSVQVGVHPGAADGALVEIFSFAGAVPPLFPPVPPEDVPEGRGQLGLQWLVLLFPPGLAVLVYGDGPGRVRGRG